MAASDIQDKTNSAGIFDPAFDVRKLDERLGEIEGALKGIARNIAQSSSRPVWIPIDSFTPEPYRVSVPFTAVLACQEDEFIASWFDADIHAAAETEEQAYSELKSMILDTFDRLEELGDSELGPGPRRQKQVLRSHIARLDA
jgi:hypothetical protein